MSESHLHNSPINLLIIDLHHFCWRSSTRPYFTCILTSSVSVFHSPSALPISLVFICLHLVIFYLHPPLILPLHCLLVSFFSSIFLLLWPSSPLSKEHLINLQLQVSNPEKRSVKAKKYRQPKAIDKNQKVEKNLSPHEHSLKSGNLKY